MVMMRIYIEHREMMLGHRLCALCLCAVIAVHLIQGGRDERSADWRNETPQGTTRALELLGYSAVLSIFPRLFQRIMPGSEVSESAFEYLICEVLALELPDAALSEQDTNSLYQQRLDNLGYDVGFRYVERLAQNRPLMSDPLEIVKFVCKDFWDDVFKKKVDKLQTNHRGVFVLSDYKFKWLDRYASDDITSKQAAARMLHFPCGILRGALANLGLSSIVVAEFNTLPACTFNIKIKSP